MMNNQQFSSLIQQLIKTIMPIDRVEKFCYGVTRTQAYTIDTIYKKEKLTMNQLSEELGLAISTLTRIIDVLVRDNIVVRFQNNKDRRKVEISLSKEGNLLAKKLDACSEQFWSKILETIPREKREDLIDNLKLLVDALVEKKRKCCQNPAKEVIK